MVHLRPIKLLILDVDGVMTSGGLPYDQPGNTIKEFHVQDGGAIRLWQQAGGHVAIISGRQSAAVAARAAELDIQLIAQGVGDKQPVFESFCKEANVSAAETAFVGDDLLDIAPMRKCGYPIAVANAVPLVKRAAAYVTRRAGGSGAIAEAVERLFRRNGSWSSVAGRWSADRASTDT
jgi:3-deoxy-D-manno-octulosonate 8-phosphate phosphatase (KDO 8-P phosphatase)